MRGSPVRNPLTRYRHPVVRQYDRVDCGPAVLLSLLRFHGGDAPLPRVRELASTDARGTTLLKLEEAARELGFDPQGAAGDYDALVDEVNEPCVAHVVVEGRLQHYVVVYRASPREVLVGDPRQGLVTMSRDEFESIWQSGAVLLLEPSDALVYEPTPRWYAWMARQFVRHESWLAQSLFLGLIYTVLGLLTAVFVQWLIDRFIPNGDWTRTLLVGAGLFVVLAIRAVAGYMRRRFSVELVKRVNTDINRRFLAHLFRLPMSFFDRHRKGDVASRIHDGVRVQNGLRQILGTVVVDGLILVGSISLCFYFSQHLGWVAAAAIPLYGGFLFLASGRLRRRQRSMLQAYGMLESSYVDSLDSVGAVKSYWAHDHFSARNTALHDEYQERVWRFGLTEAGVAFFSDTVETLLTVGTLLLGAWLVMQGELQLGEMIAAYSLVGNALPAGMRISNGFVALQGASAAANRLMDLLLIDPEESGGDRFRMEREMVVEDGVFTWPNGDVLLEDIHFRLRIGEVTGLWGASGTGKTTLVHLVQRRYEFTSGEFLVDGRPAADIDLADHRRNVGMLPEATEIFTGSLGENILVGRPVQGPDEVEDRLRELGLAWIADRFPEGLATRVGERGRQLSSGERQLVGLARALWDEPVVLVVDEGIHTLDVETRSRVMEIVQDYAREHAMLLISHHPDDLADCDTIYELRNRTVRPIRPSIVGDHQGQAETRTTAAGDS